MKIGESLFDISYLILAIALGDSFHLIPRIVSHLSPGGFEANINALSWGKFVTSITMTIFYVLYYYFYRKQTGDYDNKKKILVYVLAVIRILLVLMPQNNWGTANEAYEWGIYRNIPFLILGILLIIWSYKEKEKPGLKNMWWLMLLSFAFYIPVVLFSKKYPAVGALMMPKTIAYLLIVVFGFKYFVDGFNKSSILKTSVNCVILGIFCWSILKKIY